MKRLCSKLPTKLTNFFQVEGMISCDAKSKKKDVCKGVHDAEKKNRNIVVKFVFIYYKAAICYQHLLLKNEIIYTT